MKWLIQLLIDIFTNKPNDDTLPINPELNINDEVSDEEAAMCLQIHAAYTKEIGVTEYSSSGRKRIAEYHNASNARGSSYATAWCSSMMCFICKALGFFSTGKALARSWEKAGLKKITKPVKGCIVVFWRGSKSSGYGHVGCYDSDAGDSVRVLGGNQLNTVCKANYPKSRLVGYYLPKKA